MDVGRMTFDPRTLPYVFHGESDEEDGFQISLMRADELVREVCMH